MGKEMKNIQQRIKELKARVFDILRQQEALSLQIRELERQKRPLVEEIEKLEGELKKELENKK